MDRGEVLTQFWGRQIAIVLVSVALFVALFFVAGSELQNLPREAFGVLFTAFATLAGLTFTAFSILATFIPGLRKDFVKSRTFAAMGQTFVLSMATELLAFLLAGLTFLAFGRPGIVVAGLASVYLAILSVGFLAQLMADMSTLFKMARTGP